jgi:hypothetical protein
MHLLYLNRLHITYTLSTTLFNIVTISSFTRKPICLLNREQRQYYFKLHTTISIKVVPEESGKVEYDRERLAGNR